MDCSTKDIGIRVPPCMCLMAIQHLRVDVKSSGTGTETFFIIMININSNSNVALLNNNGTSAYETGTQSFSSNALRSYNPDGKRRRKPSATSAMRADMVVMLMNAFPHIRRVKIHDSGIDFQARVRLQGGGIVYRTAYNLQNLYGLLLDGIRDRLAV